MKKVVLKGWLARDGEESYSSDKVYFYRRKPKWYKKDKEWKLGNAGLGEIYLFPLTMIFLEPGEGPIRVKMTIEEEK